MRPLALLIMASWLGLIGDLTCTPGPSFTFLWRLPIGTRATRALMDLGTPGLTAMWSACRWKHDCASWASHLPHRFGWFRTIAPAVGSADIVITCITKATILYAVLDTIRHLANMLTYTQFTHIPWQGMCYSAGSDNLFHHAQCYGVHPTVSSYIPEVTYRGKAHLSFPPNRRHYIPLHSSQFALHVGDGWMTANRVLSA